MIMDKHLKNIFKAVDKQTKLLQKQMGKVNGNKFVKGQEKFVFENMMPPMIHATVTSPRLISPVFRQGRTSKHLKIC